MDFPIPLPDKPRILVVTLRRLGDVLLTTPLIRSAKRTWPDAAIDMLVFDGTQGIVQGNPDIHRIIVMSRHRGPVGAIGLMLSLFKRYHLAISTHPGDRPTLFAVLAGRRCAGLVDPEGPPAGRAVKRLLLHRQMASDGNLHRVEQVLRLADLIGATRIPEVVYPAPEPLPFTAGGPYAVVHAAPMFRYKQWTAEGWRAIAAGLKQRGLAVIAIGGPDPAERDYLARVWRGTVAVHRLSWAQDVTLLQGARLFVGPDTSTSHLAAAIGCPTVVLFGPTDPRIWGPWPKGGLQQPWQDASPLQNRGNVWLVQNPLPCLPCQLEGCERRIESASTCLEELKAEQVLQAVDQALAPS